MRYIAVGKSDKIDFVFSNECGELLLWIDGDTLGIGRSGQLRRITAVVYIRNLGCGKSDDTIPWVVFEINIEIVKIPTGRSN